MTEGEQTAPKAARKAKAEKPKEIPLTDYVVLIERETEADAKAYFPVRGEDGKPRVFAAKSGELAIEDYAGKAGDADAKPGRYKSVAWSSWKGILDVPEPVQIAVQKPSYIPDE